MNVQTFSRVPIAGALSDVEKFLDCAQRLKALAIQLHQRRCRESRYERSLSQQIDALTVFCAELALDNPRVTELWDQAQREILRLTTG